MVLMQAFSTSISAAVIPVWFLFGHIICWVILFEENVGIKKLSDWIVFYSVSTKVSSRHLRMQTQFKLIVKNELVAT